MKKRLLDLRFSPVFFDEDVTGKLGHLFMHLGHIYLSKTRHQFLIEDTEIIEVFVVNIDNPKASVDEYYRLGEDSTNNIGAARFLISGKELVSLSDEEKRRFLLKCLHDTLSKYVFHFQGESLIPNQAFQAIADSDPFVKHTEPAVSPDKLFECWVERRVGYEESEYRFALLITQSREVEYYYIGNKKHLDSQKLKDIPISELIAIPRFFDQEQWLNNTEFKVSWGSDQYILNVDTKQVTKKIVSC